jgi:hypothetical protein
VVACADDALTLPVQVAEARVDKQFKHSAATVDGYGPPRAAAEPSEERFPVGQRYREIVSAVPS